MEDKLPANVKAIVWVRKGVAQKNLLMHVKDGGISKIKKQIGRGSVIIKSVKNDIRTISRNCYS